MPRHRRQTVKTGVKEICKGEVDSQLDEAQDFAPVFVNVKEEPVEHNDDYNETEGQTVQNKQESPQHLLDPLSNIKVEYNACVSNNTTAGMCMVPAVSTTSTINTAAAVKQELLSDEDTSMDMDYESQEWTEQGLNSDGDNTSISISDNLDNLKQEMSSDESSEESSSEEDIDDGDEDDDDDDDNDNDIDDDEEVEEDNDDSDSRMTALRRLLHLLSSRPETISEMPEIAILLLLVLRRRRRMRKLRNMKRRRWTLSENSERIARMNFEKRFTERRQNHNQFVADFNMSIKTFDELLNKVYHRIKRKDTNMRYAITPAERLAVTLRYLTSGYSYTQLLSEFDIGKTTISGIVKTTTEIIWQELRKEYMPNPKKEDWLKMAEKFYKKTNFPNCLGSICSKYVKVIVPKAKESEFDKHQKYFATAILAIVDPDMNFIDISVGVLGNSNDNFLVKSTIGQKITKDLFDIPEPRPLSDSSSPPVPYVFVSKDSLNINIMKPFSKTSDEKKLIFNQRLEKALTISEDCLRIVANKWRVLRRGIGHHTYAEPTIKTICILHNFVMKHEGVKADVEDDWALDGVPSCGARGTVSANQVRENFADYFVSPEGSVPWQYLKPQSATKSQTGMDFQNDDLETNAKVGKDVE